MPEFILDIGEPEAARRYNALDEFTQGYIEAMFFTSTGTGDDNELEHATVAELAPQALADIIEDCTAFQKYNRADLDEAIDIGTLYREQYDLKCAGRDFWYTRCGHGVGFWDRGLGKQLGDKLTSACRPWGSRDLYRGDDGLIYLA